MTLPLHPNEVPGYFSALNPSGSGFVDLDTGEQAFVLPSLIRRMALRPGDRLLCRLVPNFPDRATDRVPWRVVHVSLPHTSTDTTAPLRPRVLAFLEDRGGAWTSEELATELSLEDRFVQETLAVLAEQGLVSSAQLRRNTPTGFGVETFWSSDYDALIPVGAFDEEEDVL